MKLADLFRNAPGVVGLISAMLLSGCFQEKAKLNVDTKASDSLREVNKGAIGEAEPVLIRKISERTEIVSGKPLSSEEAPAEPDDGDTAEDKTGAVAVQTRY